MEQHGSLKTMQHIARCLLAQKNIDGVMMIFVMMPESVFDIEEAFGGLVREFPEKTVLICHFGGTEKEMKHLRRGFAGLGIPCYPSPDRALAVFKALSDYSKVKRRRRRKRGHHT